MRTLLLIEDNALNRDMLARRLERRGYRVVTAESGERGLEMVPEQEPDLILLDITLPEMDGWEVARRLKAEPATRALPIIALTARALSSDRALALAAGCDDYFTKPVDFEGLAARIMSLLEGR